ncbi:MAG TPA: AAA family ATPase, partial [Gemmatimonadaceae bacterium]|nr:AAA family ATPase [Gemmatimonadaceae bacterium]
MAPRPIREVSAEATGGEERLEQSLRPATFEEYVGQEKLVANFRVYARAAVGRGEALDHVLLCGPPGLGKTSLAHILARELKVNLHVTSGPALVKKGDLAGLLTALAPRDILFIDEIHRLTPAVEEALYPAMEDYRFDVVLGAGLGAETMEMRLERFTLVGATTRTGLLASPLRDRFPIQERLDFYGAEQLREIAVRAASKLGVPVEPAGAEAL